MKEQGYDPHPVAKVAIILMFHEKKLHYCVTKCDKVLSCDVSLHHNADECSHHHVFNATLIFEFNFNII